MSTEIKTIIGKYDRATRQVSVTFEHAGVTHTRDVNAVVSDKGRYDQAATEARIKDVATGVAHKIEIGVITNPPLVELPSE